MKLIKGKFYTKDNSNIIVFIRDIWSFDEKATVASTLIFKKSDNTLLEEAQEYKLVHSRINDWEEVENAEI